MKDKNQNTKTAMQSDTLTLSVQINTYFRRKKPTYVKNDLPSLTQPDMALSMRQILDRFSRGQSIPRKTDAYYSEEDTTEFDKMDEFEKMDAAHNIRQDIKQMQDELQKQQQNPPQQTQSKKQNPESTRDQSVQNSDQKKEKDKDEA